MDAIIDSRHKLNTAVASLPFVAVMRGIRPVESAQIGTCLYEAGFRIIEVPLNSENPFGSVETLRKTLPADAIVGAGTVLAPDDVRRVYDAGGEAIFSPHGDPAVIRSAKAMKLISVPGIMTPTEAFSAISAGADALKIFPAELITPKIIKAMRAVLPKDLLLLAFGGITPDTMKPYVDAGAGAFGLGSALYKPGMSSAEVATRAKGFAEAWHQLRKG
jgi:2-dehydro-3-deoxyphosphogalactonate aldolase